MKIDRGHYSQTGKSNITFVQHLGLPEYLHRTCGYPYYRSVWGFAYSDWWVIEAEEVAHAYAWAKNAIGLPGWTGHAFVSAWDQESELHRVP